MLVFSDKGVRLWNPVTSKNSGLKKFTGGGGDSKTGGSNAPGARPDKFASLRRPPTNAPEPRPSGSRPPPSLPPSGSRPAPSLPSSGSRAPPPLPPRLPPRPSGSATEYRQRPPIPPRPEVPPRPSQPSHAATNLPSGTSGILPPSSSNRWVPPAEAVPPDVHPPRDTAPEDQEDFASGTCLKCRDFSAVDEHARQYPRETLAYYGYTIPQLAEELTSHLDNWTDRARAIFAWCADNIAYDKELYFPTPGGMSSAERNRSQGADTVFATGVAVCAGYAGLYAELARHAGLECTVVNGFGKGFGFTDGSRPAFDSNHAWSAVRLDDGEWHLLDACWGAGAISAEIRDFKKSFDPTMFTATSEEFGRRHFPSESGWQLRADGSTQTWDDFLDDCDAPHVFPDFKQAGYSEAALDPARKTLQMGSHTFTLWHACPHEDARSRQEDHYLPMLGCGDGQYHPFDFWPGTGCWSLTHELTRPGEVHIWYLKEAGGRDARGIGPREYDREVKGRQAYSFGGLVKYIVA